MRSELSDPALPARGSVDQLNDRNDLKMKGWKTPAQPSKDRIGEDHFAVEILRLSFWGRHAASSWLNVAGEHAFVWDSGTAKFGHGHSEALSASHD